ncbi:MAG: pantetheine-phosphate adenylyltransferase [Gemmatimonadota bacterium]|nr:pantetheine-phosphate adenylyltransferase [Gemmatimonadota bacterium]MDH3428267.1 pantetheine-phosphate adenylyltransferase [Gemmatimonadota bacterium]
MSLAGSTAIYPGSFDPLTLGHDDIVRRALRLADRVLIAVAETSTHVKRPAFSLEERVSLITEVYADEPGVEVVPFSGLLVDFAARHGARVIIRGLRAVSDFEYEFQMALMNRSLSPEIEVIFMAPASNYTFLSSSLVREVAALGGDVSPYVPHIVLERLARRYGGAPDG